MEPVKLTEQAVKSAKDFIGEDEGVLRLSVRGGGCSGFQYFLSLDKAHEGDILYDQSGLGVAVDPLALPYLQGATLDYKRDLNESGFVFDNPNAKGGCGCGSSFRVDDQEGCDSQGPTLDELEVSEYGADDPL